MIDLNEARALAEAARADTADGLTAREQLAEVVLDLCDQAEKLTPPRTSEEQRARLLTEIREVGGEWTGLRVARFWWTAYQCQITPERGVQHLLRLMQAGHLVLTRPPRGRTFVLAGDLQQPPGMQWGNRMRIEEVGERNVLRGSEWLARDAVAERIPGVKVLLRRTVTYGPWIEVLAEAEVSGA